MLDSIKVQLVAHLYGLCIAAYLCVLTKWNRFWKH